MRRQVIGVSLGFLVLCSTTAFAAPAFGPVRLLDANATVDITQFQDHSPIVASDGASTWVALWSSFDLMGSSIDQDIRVSRSTDNGVTWSASTLLHPDLETDLPNDLYLDVATDRNGNWIAAWTREHYLDGQRITVSRSADNGATWSAPEYLHDYAASQGWLPSIATDGSGGWIAVWSRPIGHYEMVFSRSVDNGATWSVPAFLAPALVSDNVNDLPTGLAADGSGNWLVSFSNDGGSFVTASADGGVSWGAPVLIHPMFSTAPVFPRTPSLATDRNGTWLFVASAGLLAPSGSYVHDVYVSRSADGGGTWSAPAKVNQDSATGTTSNSASQLVYADDGLWVVVWWGGGWKIASSTDLGQSWQGERPLLTTTDPLGSTLNVASNDTGTWIAVWDSDDALDGQVGPDLDVVYSRGAGCTGAPAAGCWPTRARGSRLRVVDRVDDRSDVVAWSWAGSTDTFADLPEPLAGDAWAVCLYDRRSGASRLLRDWGGFLHGKSSKSNVRFTYRDRTVRADGLRALSVRATARGPARALLRAKGPAVLPELPLTHPATVQIRNADLCWEASYSASPAAGTATRSVLVSD